MNTWVLKACFLVGSFAVSWYTATAADPFLFGVANSAFQVEGYPADSDWLRWTKTPGKIKDGTNANLATRFWDRYEEDFELASKAGFNAFRVSIAWERVEPKDGEFDESAISQYLQMIRSLRLRGLEPVVTLQHFTLPQWLAERGGIHAPDFVEKITRYSKRIVPILASEPVNARWFVTVNEPEVLSIAGYMEGSWPPGRSGDIGGFFKSLSILAEAHIEIVRAFRTSHPELKFSIAKNYMVFEPKNPKLDSKLAATADRMYNRQILDALTTGVLRFGIPDISEKTYKTVKLPEGRSSLDYMGINYYSRQIVAPENFKLLPPGLKYAGPDRKNDLGWNVYPRGILVLSEKVWARYKLPILITENGVPTRDEKFRSQFLREHVGYLLEARAKGIGVIGYLHWSLTDNFEWAYGLAPRFGLVGVKYDSGERTPRPAFFTYQQMIRDFRATGLVK